MLRVGAAPGCLPNGLTIARRAVRVQLTPELESRPAEEGRASAHSCGVAQSPPAAVFREVLPLVRGHRVASSAAAWVGPAALRDAGLQCPQRPWRFRLPGRR